MPLLRRQRGEPKRIRRTDRRGMSPVTFGAIAAVVLLVVVYFGFTKAIPFRHDFRLNAVFANANSMRIGTQVRIAGVNVGKVTKVSRYKDSEASLVQMELKDNGLPIHKDATAKIRPRIFLEGNFFVDLKPGSPSAPTLEDDDAPLAMTQTAAPVQFGDVLTALQSDTRRDLQKVLIDFGRALNGRPTAAQDADADPDARGKTAARSLRDSATYSADALKGAAIVNSAVLGLQGDDLSRLVSSLSRVSAALDRNEGSLQGLVTNFNRTMAALASQEANLRATIRELPPTLDQADAAFDALNRAFPPTRAFAREILPGVRESAETIDASFPFVVQVRRLVSEPELRGLVSVLRPTTRDLAGLVDATTELLPQVDPVNRCVIGNLLPVLKTPLQDGNLSTGVQNYKELSHTLVAAAGESENFDGNGQYVRIGAGGGPNTVSTGKSTLGGPQLFANMNLRPLGTRPTFSGKRPPYRPDVPCASQEAPDLRSDAGGGETLLARKAVSTASRATGASAGAKPEGDQRVLEELSPTPKGAGAKSGGKASDGGEGGR
jgi:phospholipid/cholesterol/gamma-HCH transport system substrate-binding protein